MHPIRPQVLVAASGLAAIVSGSLLPATVRADVSEYAVARHLTYVQTSNAPPAAPEYWSLQALVSSEVANEVLSATIEFNAPPPVTYNLYEAIPTLHQFNSSYYTSEEDFLLAYPATTYTLAVDRGAGPESGDVFLPEDQYCPETPWFTGDTHERLQDCDPALAFDGTINGFTLAPGTDEGSSTVVVVEVGVPSATLVVDLQPGDTAFQIPAGLLAPSTDYTISVTYFNVDLTQNAGFGSATSGAQFSRTTSALFTTMSAFCPADFNRDGFVDPLDYNGFINAFEAGDMSADFNADTFLDPLDYNGFINAFEAGC